LKNGFRQRQVDTTLFIKSLKNESLNLQIYVDDITFVYTNTAISVKSFPR